MRFVKDNGRCGLCNGALETLVTCYHSNPLINYLNITAKWYISNKFQNKKRLLWDEYIRFVIFALTGNGEV